MKAANAAAFHPSGPQPTCLSALLITLASRARAGQEAECNTPVLSELWNPVAGRPPLSERLHLIVLLPIPPPLPPDSVGDRHHGLVNQPIQCGGNRGVCWTDAQAPCQDRRQAAELWNPVAAHLLCLGAVCAVGAPRLHFCTSASHLQCHPSVTRDTKVKQKKNKKTQPVSRKMSFFPQLSSFQLSACSNTLFLLCTFYSLRSSLFKYAC